MFHMKQSTRSALLGLAIGVISSYALAWLQLSWEQAHIFNELEGQNLPICREAAK